MKSKFLVLIIATTALLLFNSCSKSSGSGSTTPPPADPNHINITGMSFPGSVTVKQGSTVYWNNKDAIAHTVTADDGSFNSGTLAAGATFSFVVNTAGTYTYHCNFHSGMKGTLVVTP